MTKENINIEKEEELLNDETAVTDAEIPKVENTDEEDSGDFKWYAVRIISGHENKVKAYLDNEIRNEKLEDKIRNVLIPLEKILQYFIINMD